MAKPYRVKVFGKAGCDKCAVLNQRLDKLLEKEEWQGFEKEYCDVGTEIGLVDFCEAECINPQRIPAMLVMQGNETAGRFEPLPNPKPGSRDTICGDSRLFQYLGLQTDYYGGKGVITPKMITAVLQDAVSFDATG